MWFQLTCNAPEKQLVACDVLETSELVGFQCGTRMIKAPHDVAETNRNSRDEAAVLVFYNMMMYGLLRLGIPARLQMRVLSAQS